MFSYKRHMLQKHCKIHRFSMNFEVLGGLCWPKLGHLGAMLELGWPMLGNLGAMLELSWPMLGYLGGMLGLCWPILEHVGAKLGQVWGKLCSIWG